MQASYRRPSLPNELTIEYPNNHLDNNFFASSHKRNGVEESFTIHIQTK